MSSKKRGASGAGVPARDASSEVHLNICGNNQCEDCRDLVKRHMRDPRAVYVNLHPSVHRVQVDGPYARRGWFVRAWARLCYCIGGV
ncbi:MAG: hypothetical protein RL341_1839 [Pseudomonadota bacterium]